jgi:hypothetical protein
VSAARWLIPDIGNYDAPCGSWSTDIRPSGNGLVTAWPTRVGADLTISPGSPNPRRFLAGTAADSPWWLVLRVLGD